MKVQEGIEIVKGLVNSKPLGGMTMLQAFQACADEIYSRDSYVRLREFSYITTIAATLTYSFETLFGATSTRIRKLKGVYDPSIATGISTDYGRSKFPAEADQRIMRRRVYADETVVVINNEESKIVFAADPGATTAAWKADYYESAPTLELLSVLPVIRGWEYRLFINGVQSYWEMARLKKPGPVRELFLMDLEEYYDALQRDYDLLKHNSIEGFRPQIHVVPL